MTGRRRWALRVVLCFWTPALLWAVAGVAWGEPPKLPLEREVTFITEPLRADGFVDYYAAIRQMRREGVAPENNLFVDLLKLYGPRSLFFGDPGSDAERFEELGIDGLPAGAEYLPRSLSFEVEDYQAVERPWLPFEFPRVHALLVRFESPLDAFIDALFEKEHYYAPILREPAEPLSELPLPDIQQTRELGRVISARVMLYTRLGEIEKARRDIDALFHMAKLVPDPPFPIELLVGNANRTIADSALQQFLSHAPISSEQALAWLEEFDGYPGLPSAADSVNFTARMMALDEGIAQATGRLTYVEGLPPWHGFVQVELEYYSRRTNEIMDKVTELWGLSESATVAERHLIATELLDYMQQLQPHVRDVPRRVWWPRRMLADALIERNVPALAQLYRSQGRILAYGMNHRAALAVAAYRADHGRYPVSLDALVPRYLDAVPPDVITGRPLSYRVQEDQVLIYSWGHNARDDEGSPASDFLFRFEIKKGET